MSTTFDVIPGKPVAFSVDDVLHISGRHMNARLRELGVKTAITLNSRLMDERSGREVTARSPSFEWREDQYLWIFIDGIPGGTDVYCRGVTESVPDWYYEAFHEAPTRNQAIVSAAEQISRIWSFRRSAGQPAIISLAYGVIAATVADLSNGLITSYDSAWDGRTLPTTGESFLAQYFRPSATLAPEFTDWSERCLAIISKELG